MRIYLAAIYTNNLSQHGSTYNSLNEIEQNSVQNIPYILDSYHYIHRQRYVDAIRRDNRVVFLDSGAFSAFTKGVQVDLPGYCRYIQQNSDIISVASVLDGIGDAQLTWENQHAMQQHGVTPLPCFHYGEPTEYLDAYVENYEYITLGGMVPISTPQLKIWLDRMWSKHLTDENGKPRCKVHGFGLTSVPLMERYPWYSVDSSSWVQVSSNGSVLLPSGKTLGVSNTSPSRKIAGQHIDTISEIEKEHVVQQIQDMGYSKELLFTSYKHRWCFNIEVFNRMNQKYAGKEKVFNATVQELF